MPSPRAQVRAAQREWARSKGIAVDNQGYTLNLDDNLYLPLSSASRDEFAKGDGAELPLPGKRGKMQALHSSSALAYNVFEYWRQHSPTPLAETLGLEEEITEVRFEQKFPTGLPGNAPNLDVVLGLRSGTFIAIESKFLEPYARHPVGFNPKYFEAERAFWLENGLNRCQELARQIQDGEREFRWLHAQQLLKHALGLSSATQDWSLWYLSYQVDGIPGREHAEEAEEFGALVKPDCIGFRSLTYQELFASLQKACNSKHQIYLDYLGDRYFA